jgi:signal transduction histidine kinase
MAVVAPTTLSLPQLLAALTHDLKNPLAALTTNLHFMSDSSDDPAGERREALDDSMVVSEQLDLLLRNLELFARGEAPSSRTAQVALGSIVDEALRRVDRIARAAELTIERAAAPASARAFADGDLLVRALENCLMNAIEHAPRNGLITIEVESANDASIRVGAQRVRSWLIFDGDDVSGQRPQSVYGRGLSLLCADLAARAGGARLELARTQTGTTVSLIAPARG